IGTAMGFASEPLMRAARQWWDSREPVPQALRANSNQVILVSSPNAGRGADMKRARTAMAGAGLQVVAELGIDDIAKLPSLLSRHDSRPPAALGPGGRVTGAAGGA